MMKNYLSSNNSLGKVVLEVVGIVFAVLVALAADEWVDDREKHERKLLLINNINNEIATNSVELKRSLEELDSQLKKISSIIDQNRDKASIGIDDNVTEIWHVSLPALRETSWHSLTLQSEIFTLINLEQIEVLSSIYSLQNSLDVVGKRLIVEFGESTANLTEPGSSKKALIKHMYNISTTQQLAANLNILYDEYLAMNFD